MTIALASDHAGFGLKKEIIAFFESMFIETKDFGTYSEESADYPDFAHPLAQAVQNKEFTFGFSICGSGNGINMVVNKYPEIRSALCWNNEISKLARQHNDANICALPARFVSTTEALEIVNTFITTEFEGGRHLTRINKIPIQ